LLIAKGDPQFYYIYILEAIEMDIFYVYILKLTLKNGKVKYYTGQTCDLESRILQHANWFILKEFMEQGEMQ